jgi:hypothetical protein
MFRQSGLLVEIIPELGGGGERGRVTEIRMGQGRGGLPPPAAAPLPCIRSGLPPRRSTASPRTSTRRVRLLLSAHAVAMEKPKSEPGASAATKDDHASPDRLPTDSGSLDGAPSSRATAPQQPSDQHAASAAAAAYDARATPPDPDAVWSIVLAKFGRGRRGGVDLAAHTFLDPASGVGMVSPERFATPRAGAVEKPESEPSDSASAAAGDATSSSTPISPPWIQAPPQRFGHGRHRAHLATVAAATARGEGRSRFPVGGWGGG